MSPDPALSAVGCVSLETWDDVWRRNQHVASRLVRLGLAHRIVFVEPPMLGHGAQRREVGEPGVEVVRPSLYVPKRLGGLRVAGLSLVRGHLRDVDVLWINDPTLGVHCMRQQVPTAYDVTDDWRSFDAPHHIRRRLVAAEDALSHSARTIVCSEVLRDRWQQRYGVGAAVVQNGVDTRAVQTSTPHSLLGQAPHVGYVGTLHPERLDVALVIELSERLGGTVHLVGPIDLPEGARRRLAAAGGVRLEGPVTASQVPAWTTAMDVLICPHLINDFTLSLDAIKAHEYLATARPVVATRTSGFQALDAAGLSVVDRVSFSAAVLAALDVAPVRRVVVDWDVRTRAFAHELRAVAG